MEKGKRKLDSDGTMPFFISIRFDLMYSQKIAIRFNAIDVPVNIDRVACHRWWYAQYRSSSSTCFACFARGGSDTLVAAAVVTTCSLLVGCE